MKKIKFKKIFGRIFNISFVLILLLSIVLPKKKNEFIKSNELIENPHKLLNNEILRIGMQKLNKPLNPFFDGGSEISVISRLLHPSLFYKDKNNRIKTDLVKEYWYENDGKTIAIVLNKNHKFSKDKTLEAKHIYNTYKILSDPQYTGTYSNYAEQLRGYYDYKSRINTNFQGVEIVEDFYIKFHFRNFDVNNIGFLTFPILEIENEDFSYENIENIKNKEFLTGAGKYIAIENKNNKTHLILKQGNDDIRLKDIEIYEYLGQEVLNEYKKGHIDIIYDFSNKTDLYSKLEERLQKNSYSMDYESNKYIFIGFNKESKIFSNVEYRRALRDTLDIEQLVEKNFEKYVYDFPKFPIYKNAWYNKTKIEVNQKTSLKDLLNRDSVNGIKNQVIELIVLKDNNFFNKIEKDFVAMVEKEGIKLNVTKLSVNEMFEALSGKRKFDIFISERYFSQFPTSNLAKKYPAEMIHENSIINKQGIYYLEEVNNRRILDIHILELVNEWKLDYINNIPEIMLVSENMTTIINNRISGVYINEFIGLDDIENLENIKFGVR